MLGTSGLQSRGMGCIEVLGHPAVAKYQILCMIGGPHPLVLLPTQPVQVAAERPAPEDGLNDTASLSTGLFLIILRCAALLCVLSYLGQISSHQAPRSSNTACASALHFCSETPICTARLFHAC